MRQTRQQMKSHSWSRHSSGRWETGQAERGVKPWFQRRSEGHTSGSRGRNHSKSPWQILGGDGDQQRGRSHWQKRGSDSEGKSPSNGTVQLLFVLCTEVRREALCFPGRFLSCSWQWQWAVGLFLYSELVLGGRAKSREPREQSSLWKGWKRIKSSQYPQSHQELPVTICSLVCSWDNIDLVCLLKHHFHNRIYHWRKWIHTLMAGNFNAPMVTMEISSRTVGTHAIKITTGQCNLKGYINKTFTSSGETEILPFDLSDPRNNSLINCWVCTAKF